MPDFEQRVQRVRHLLEEGGATSGIMPKPIETATMNRL